MKKNYRIKKEQEFQSIIRKKKSFANRNFVVYIAENPDIDHFRVGISVGKKVGNAVTRNRVKRQIRQGLFELKEQIDPMFDLILIARPGIVRLSTEEVRKNIYHVLNLATIIRKNRGNQE